jgi:hypothetical protein
MFACLLAQLTKKRSPDLTAFRSSTQVSNAQSESLLPSSSAVMSGKPLLS